MEISENAQEFLESLWIAIHEELKMSFPIDKKQRDIVSELVKLGLIIKTGNRVTLTKRGEQEAALAVRRHRLAERLLTDVINTAEHLLNEQACRLEHVLFTGLDESICTLLGHPRFCPHGKPIPKGKCCEQKREKIERLLVPLCEMKPGQSGKIAYIHMNGVNHLGKILAMGVLPGVRITLIRRNPSVVFRAGYSQFAVDMDIAAAIYVRLSLSGE